MRTSSRSWALLLPLLALLGCRALAPAPHEKPPNVVLIVSDDQRWTDYGFMGHEHVRTPHLDRLADESILFPRGYVPASLCRPSLASIITGRWPHQHRLTSNDPPEGAPREVLTRHIDDVPTLPRLLGERGYVSFQSGKWWEGSFARGGFTRGMTRGERHGDDGLTIGREGMEPIFEFVDEAVDDGKPFFVWYAPFLPHRPHDPPARLLGRYENLAPSPFVARYWAMCEWLDETCGELLDFLDDRGLAADTLVLFVCDNGWIQLPDESGYAPRSKRSPYDGGLRTPILVRWPGRPRGFAPGRSSFPVSSLDLAPTILEACGLPREPGLGGVSLLDPLALARRPAIFGDVYAHDAVDPDDPVSSLRWRWCIEGRWKLILPHLSDESPRLFDLRADPHEEHDLAAARPELVEALARRIDRWWPARAAD